ncbi:MAG: RloB domain-containing protein [Hymenobacter sp.]|nr:MAG: RloB domain-containing protein [Hymenobacter sp.]
MARAGKIEAKSRRGRTPAEDKRPIRWRHYKHLVLIVCEGQTEKLYFETVFATLLSEKVFVRPISAGRDPLGVAEQAIAEREKLRSEAKKEVDRVWLAFDKDDADREPGKKTRFMQAIQLAQDEKMQLAFSNEAFELWLLLHFAEVDATVPLSRQELYELLAAALQLHPLFATNSYDHKKSKAANVLQAVLELGDANLAHGRAEALLAAHSGKPLLETNPSTRVHVLLHSLRGWVELYH